MRNWNQLSSDELFAIWNAYLQSDFGGYDPLRQNLHPFMGIKMKLTPMDIHKMVDELFERVRVKEGYEGYGQKNA